jgi:hypothetical protein
MTHTPGPWTWQYGEGFFAGKSVPVVTIESDGACGDPECCGAPSYVIETRQEDAALIVAAPDLLAALKRSLNWLSSYPGGNATGAYDEARAAIAKAEGGE